MGGTIDLYSICITSVPPSVRTEPASGEITVREGTSVSLECRLVIIIGVDKEKEREKEIG